MKNRIKKNDIVHIDQAFDRSDPDLRPSLAGAGVFTVVLVDGDYLDIVNAQGQKDTTHVHRCCEYWGIVAEPATEAMTEEPAQVAEEEANEAATEAESSPVDEAPPVEDQEPKGNKKPKK